MVTRSTFIHQFALGLGCALLLAACAGPLERDASSPSGTNTENGEVPTPILQVATCSMLPPFEFEGATGELEGFDIDLMDAIAQVGGFAVEYNVLPFKDIIPALQRETADIGLCNIIITRERLEKVDFSRPYFKAGQAIVVPLYTTTLQTLDDLQGKTIGVHTGTVGDDLAATIPNAQVKQFDSGLLALQNLSNGTVDAVIQGAAISLAMIAQGSPDNNLDNIEVVGAFLTQEVYGIAVPKGSEHLATIDAALNQILTDDTYAKLYQRWFRATPPQIPDSPF